MPKMKTHTGSKKRFKLTGTGKVKRSQAFTSHLMTNKPKKARLRLVKNATASSADEARVKRLLACG